MAVKSVRGVVQYVPKPREVPVKGGKMANYYSIKVDDEYYSTGQKLPPEEGSLVEFDAEQNNKGYWNVTKSGVRVIKAEEPSQNVATGAVSAAQTSKMSKDDYWRRKEERDLEKDPIIQLQSCRNSAIELVKILVTPIQTKDGVEVLVKLPAQAKRVEFVENLVDQYTKKFVDENNKKNEKTIEAAVEEVSQDSGIVVESDTQVWEV